MARLRIRMELNRGGVGVPLHKLASVVDEAQKFFHMLSADVHIDPDSGEWLGVDFENKSLNFTAEFVGPVTAEQVREFYAAFDGVTPMRRATIAQFARIANAIEEDELIGFGLYQSDEEVQPAEWRALSKRDAVRIASEIQILLDQSGDSAAASRLPAALDPGEAASLFKERRDHGGLAERVARLENVVGRHGESIESLQGATTSTEQNLQKLLVAVDAFCDKASKQMERLPAAPPAVTVLQTASEEPPRRFRWGIPAAVAAVAIAVLGIVILRSTGSARPASATVQQAEPVTTIEAPAADRPAAVAKPPDPAPVAPPAVPVRVNLRAIEPTWIAVYADDKLKTARLLDAGETDEVDASHKIRMRVGNAGGIEISANGKPVGPVGPKGQARTVEFTPDAFHVVTGDSAKKSQQ